MNLSHENQGRTFLSAAMILLAAVLPAAEAGSTNPVSGVAALFTRGETLYQAADWTGAAEAYAAVLAGSPDGALAAQALYSRGWALLQAGHPEKALADFQAFREKYPSHALAAECQLKMADCLRQLRRFDEALRVYELVRTTGGRLVPDALAGKALVFQEQHEYAGAQAAFCEAAQAYGADAHAAACLFNAGNAAMEAQQFSSAVELFGRMQQAWPTNQMIRSAIYWQAMALFRQEKADEAAVKLELLRQMGVPRELAAEAGMLLAQVQDARHHYAEAATAYAAVVTNYPEHALAESAAAGSVVAFEKSGNLAAAEVAATAFVQRYPASTRRPAIHFLLGEYRYRQGHFAEAAPELERFAGNNPKHELAAAALQKAAWCCWNLRQVARARELFGRVVAEYAGSPLAVEAALMKGRTAEEAGDAAAAMDGYTEAVRLGHDDETAQRAAVELMRMNHAAKRYEAVLAGADTFLASHATSALLPRVWLYRAEALLELGHLAQALQAYRQVGSSDPVAAAAAGYGAAWVLRRQGRHSEAADAFAQVADGASTYASDARFWSARSYEDAGLFDVASKSYGACLRQVPSDTHADEAAYRQAYCLWQTHKPDDAERLYSSMIHERAASPFTANALYDLAWVMLEQGKKTEARRRFEEFTWQFPKHLLAPDAHYRIGDLAFENEEFAVAATQYEAASAAQVSFQDKAIYKLGWVREKMGQNDAAVQTFLRLARQFPHSEFVPEAYEHAGVLLQKMGRFDDARAAFAAVAEGPFSEKAACGVADCWRASGKHKEAVEAYALVLSKWPQGECRAQALLGRAGELRASGAFSDAIADYTTVAHDGETMTSAQAMMGLAYCWFALQKWEDAARCFLKVDVLYGFDELKPEALAMAARCWVQAGDPEKAAMYREDLKKRFPKSREALEL